MNLMVGWVAQGHLRGNLRPTTFLKVAQISALATLLLSFP